MSDLRTGLVEAMGRAVWESDIERVDDGTGIAYEWATLAEWGQVAYREKATAALDAALGFLTDNAEAWEQAEAELPSSPGPRRIGPWQRLWLLNLIAALSDSRDTGEKP